MSCRPSTPVLGAALIAIVLVTLIVHWPDSDTPQGASAQFGQVLERRAHAQTAQVGAPQRRPQMIRQPGQSQTRDASRATTSQKVRRLVEGATNAHRSGGSSIDERWAAEKEDERATAELTDYIAGALQDLEVDGDVDDLGCRETICRVRMHFNDLSHARKFESEAGMLERRQSLNMSITEGVIDVEVFLGRK